MFISGIESIYREVHEILINIPPVNSINTTNQKYMKKIRYGSEHKQVENNINSSRIKYNEMLKSMIINKFLWNITVIEDNIKCFIFV